MKICMNCMTAYQDTCGVCPACGYQEGQDGPPENELAPGSILQKRYIVGCLRIEEESEFTYMGWDELFQRRVLIREFFLPGQCVRQEGGRVAGEDELFGQWVEEFVQGGKQLIRLYREPDILTAYSAFKENGTGYIVTEYMIDQVLLDAQESRYETGQAVRLFVRILEAMEKCHNEGLCFGKIAPFQVYCLGDQVVLAGQRPGGLGRRREDVEWAAVLFCRMVLGLDYNFSKGRLERDLKALRPPLGKERIQILMLLLESGKPPAMSAGELMEIFEEAVFQEV